MRRNARPPASVTVAAVTVMQLVKARDGKTKQRLADAFEPADRPILEAVAGLPFALGCAAGGAVIVVYFAAFKGHIGLYPPARGDAALEKAVAAYANEKGNLRFPLDRRIPYGLIGRITKFRARAAR